MNTPMRNSTERGSALVEFTLVGITVMFILISIFEIARGMWMYHTLAYAVKDAVRYAAVHGQGCQSTANNCQITVANIAQRLTLQNGLDPTDSAFTVTLSSPTRTIGPATVSSLLTNTQCFPTASACGSTLDLGSLRGNPITITASYPFRSAIAMAAGWGKPGIVFGTFNLPARSRERISF